MYEDFLNVKKPQKQAEKPVIEEKQPEAPKPKTTRKPKAEK